MMQINGMKFSDFGKFNENLIVRDAQCSNPVPLKYDFIYKGCFMKAETNTQTLGGSVKHVHQ